MLVQTTNRIAEKCDRPRSAHYSRTATRVGKLLLQGAAISILVDISSALAAHSPDQKAHETRKHNALHAQTQPTRHARKLASAIRAQRIPSATHAANALRMHNLASLRSTTDTRAAATEQPAQADNRQYGEVLARGIASWYSADRYNKLTASGAKFDENAMTAAHHSLPLGTRVRVTLDNSHESVVVTINDRLGMPSRLIDLSKGAARQLGILSRGVARVTLTRS